MPSSLYRDRHRVRTAFGFALVLSSAIAAPFSFLAPAMAASSQAFASCVSGIGKQIVYTAPGATVAITVPASAIPGVSAPSVSWSTTVPLATVGSLPASVGTLSALAPNFDSSQVVYLTTSPSSSGISGVISFYGSPPKGGNLQVFLACVSIGDTSSQIGSTFTPAAPAGPCLIIDSGQSVAFGTVITGGATPTPGDTPTVVRSCSAAAENVAAQVSNATGGTNTYTPASGALGSTNFGYGMTVITGSTSNLTAGNVRTAIVSTPSVVAAGGANSTTTPVASQPVILAAAGGPGLTGPGGDVMTVTHDLSLGAGWPETGSLFSVNVTLTATLA